MNYIVDIVTTSREHPSIVLGVSPQVLSFWSSLSGSCFHEGRDFVTPEDVKELAPHVFGHGIVPRLKSNKVCHAELVRKVLEVISPS
ncbi:MAG: hypothetical protein R3F51_25425 [Cyanobacteriota/Melainabacteria group bacterium]